MKMPLLTYVKGHSNNIFCIFGHQMTDMRQRLTLLCSVALCLLLASCHSRKQASGVPGHGSIEYERAEIPGKHRGNKESHAERLEKEARRWLGTPYRYGGESLQGTDCSGMMMKVFEKVCGVKLPRNSAEQQQYCEPVSLRTVERGDLLFFCTSSKKGRVSHVGLYIGEGDFIHASSSKGVIISNMKQDYYRRHFHSAGRVPGLSTTMKKNTPPPIFIKQDPATPPEELTGPVMPELSPDTIPPKPEAPTSADSIRNEVRRAMVW